MTLIWELDFYSRPILDETGKRLWEVVLCEAPNRVDQTLETCFSYAEFCPNTQVNSLWLQGALERAMEQSGTKPTLIRFFRRQMNNMITKTCGDLGISCVLSRRTIVLHETLKHRMTAVYPQEPGYEDRIDYLKDRNQLTKESVRQFKKDEQVRQQEMNSQLEQIRHVS